MSDLARTLALAESHLSIDLRRAVAQLTVRQQQAVLLVHIIGMTESEAADALDRTQQAVNKSLKSSVQKLQKIFLTSMVVKNTLRGPY